MNWFDASAASLFGLSGSEQMLAGSLNNITLLNKNAFVLTNTNSTNIDNSSNIVYNYFPDVFNHANNTVLDVSGNMNIYGNISIISDKTNTISISSDAANCNFFTNVSNFSIGKQNSNAVFNGDITVDGKINALALQFVSTAVSYLIIDSSNSNNDGLYALDVRNGGSAKIDGSMGVYGNVVLFNNSQNAFRIEGGSLFNNTMTVSGESYFYNNVTVSNPTKNISTDSSANGAFFVNGNAKVNNHLYVMKKLYIDGSNNTDSFQINAGNINLTNNVYINRDKFYVTSDASFNSNIMVNTSGKLIMNGDASFNGNLFFVGGTKIDNSGVLVMNAPSNFNSNITVNASGKLIMNGDASFNGNLFFAGGTKIDNSGVLVMNTPSNFNSNITVNAPGKLIMRGDASFNGNLFFVGGSKIDNSGALVMNTLSNFNSNITVNAPGKLIMKGDASFNGNLFFGTSNINNNGILTMNDQANFNNTIYIYQGINIYSGAMVVNSDASFNGRVYINTSYSSSNNILSDYRIKSNVSELGDTGLSIDALNPVIYTNNNTGKEDIGFIAHELQEHFPFLVNGEKDGENLQSINYNGLIGMLVRELQVLKKKVAQLERQNVL
jgi:hypothetical protein